MEMQENRAENREILYFPIFLRSKPLWLVANVETEEAWAGTLAVVIQGMGHRSTASCRAMALLARWSLLDNYNT